MFSFYDESRYSSFSSDTISKMDANDLKAYQEEYGRLTKKLLEFSESESSHSVSYLSGAYQYSITQQQELLRELAFYKSLYDQEHHDRRISDADLLHSEILLCGFLGGFILLFALPEFPFSPILMLLSPAVPIALSIAGFFILTVSSSALITAIQPSLLCTRPLIRFFWPFLLCFHLPLFCFISSLLFCADKSAPPQPVRAALIDPSYRRLLYEKENHFSAACTASVCQCPGFRTGHQQV